MRYRLRTLLIVLALGPPLLGAAWWGYCKWHEECERRELDRLNRLPGISEPVVDPSA